jgi:predicted RNA binding protein YcfA (HicA-like mRNA interferase family)
LPSLKCTYNEFIEILERYKFALHGAWGATSHYRYRGIVDGQVRYVDCSGKGNTDIPIGTLQAMIRQSGLPKKLFRK